MVGWTITLWVDDRNLHSDAESGSVGSEGGWKTTKKLAQRRWPCGPTSLRPPRLAALLSPLLGPLAAPLHSQDLQDRLRGALSIPPCMQQGLPGGGGVVQALRAPGCFIGQHGPPTHTHRWHPARPGHPPAAARRAWRLAPLHPGRGPALLRRSRARVPVLGRPRRAACARCDRARACASCPARPVTARPVTARQSPHLGPSRRRGPVHVHAGTPVPTRCNVNSCAHGCICARPRA